MNEQFEDLKRVLDALETFSERQLTFVERESFVQKVLPLQITKAIEQTIEKRHALPSTIEKVVHYTSIPALFSIFKERRLRLYDSDHTNDPKEGIYFDDGFNKRAEFGWFESKEINPSYIASFVISPPKENNQDKLVYWRTYGHDGAGCSIEFFAETRDLKLVLYGQEEVAKTYDALHSIVGQLRPLLADYGNTEMILADAIRDALSTIRYLYKSKHYEYEQECRKVLPKHEVDLKKIKFHYPAGHIYPARIRHYYHSTDLDLEEMLSRTGTTLTLGPAVYSAETTMRSIRTALNALEIIGVDVRHSQIDYQAT